MGSCKNRNNSFYFRSGVLAFRKNLLRYSCALQRAQRGASKMSLINRKFSLVSLGFLATLGLGNLFHGYERENKPKQELPQETEKQSPSADPKEVTTARIKED